MRRLDVPRRVAILRIAFGLLWAVDAYLKWQPAFLRGYVGYLHDAAQGQPAWLSPWFSLWLRVIGHAPLLFAYATAGLETLTALGLILGLARKAGYTVAAVFSLLIWSTAEGFGGPYTAGATDVGTGIVYAVVFAALYGLDTAAGDAWTVDDWLARRMPWWRRISGPVSPPG